MISSSVNNEDLNIAFNAIHFGDLDIIEKPKGEMDKDYDLVAKDIIDKVKALSEVKLISRRFSNFDTFVSNKKINKTIVPIPKKKNKFDLIGIVSSTGGPVVLNEIFSSLPANYPIPIIVVQHIAHGFGQGLVEWLNRNLELNVKFAEDNEYYKAGNIYIAKDDYHTEITTFKAFKLNQNETRYGIRPSGDMLLASLGMTLKDKTLGIVLTGMGNDGSYGMQMMYQFGSMTIAQDEESSLIYGMPKECMQADCVKKQLSIIEIKNYLNSLV